MLVYPSGIDLSNRTLRHLSGLLAGHRRQIGSRWHRLTCGRQALVVPAHLRCGDTYARLAAGFRVGIATVHRYIRKAVDLLAARAPSLEQAMPTMQKKAYVILTARCCRSTASLPTSRTTPGRTARAVHDLTAARTHGIPAALAADDIKCWADKAYQGAGLAVRIPFRGKTLCGWQRRPNRDHAKIRSLGERAMATLKSWRLLRKLRCSTTRISAVIRAVVALELAT